MINLKSHLSDEEIKAKINCSENMHEKKRWFAVYILMKGKLKIKDVADALEVTPATLTNWLKAYNNKGAEGLSVDNWGGRRNAVLSIQEERTFLNKIKKVSLYGCAVTADAVRKALQDYTKKPFTKKQVYSLLKRHRWKRRRLTPRIGDEDYLFDAHEIMFDDWLAKDNNKFASLPYWAQKHVFSLNLLIDYYRRPYRWLPGDADEYTDEIAKSGLKLE